MPKDNKKKIWEKERRDHLKEAFLKLENLLPSYDPSCPASRIDVLTKSIEYIQDLKNIIQELSKPQPEMNTKVLKVKRLQERIRRLVSRMEILSRLLREAKIPIPNACSWKDFKNKRYKWSGKLSESKISNLKYMDKKEHVNQEYGNSNNQSLECGEATCGLKSSSQVPKHRKNIVNRVKSTPIAKQKHLQPATSNCLIIYTQAYNTTPCYLVSSTSSSNFSGSTQTVLTNTEGASNPIMTTNSKRSGKALLESNSKVQPIGTGTLILSNGNIYPVLPQNQPILSTPMLVQVTNNSNSMGIKAGSIKPKKNESVDQKSVKTPKKLSSKSHNQKSIINSLNTSNVNTEDSRMLSNIFQRGPNPASSNSSLLTASINKILIPSSSTVYKPKILLPRINNRRVVAKRIGDRPVSREALRKIGRMATKTKMAEREKMVSQSKIEEVTPNVVDNTQDKSTEKEPSNKENSEISSCNNLKSVEMESIKPNEDSPKSPKTISIIADDMILKASDTNVGSECSKSTSTGSALDCQSISIPGKGNLMSKEEKESSQIEVPKEGVMNYIERNSNENASNKMQSLTENHSKNFEPPKNSPPVFNKHMEIDVNSENIENSDKSNNKSESAVPLPLPSDVQNIRPENNLDLDNECSMNQLKNLDIHLGHSELSNDLFASLQVPPGCQNPESTSPTAAFLLAFPLVSSLTGVKVTEVMDEDNPDSQRETPTLLQIGTMDTNKSAQSESFNSHLLNLDFFSSKDIYSGFYNSFEQHLSSLTMVPSNTFNEIPKITEKITSNNKFGDNFKSSNVMDSNQASSAPKPSLLNELISSTGNSNVQNDRGFLSSNINCQINFMGKQSNSASSSGKNNIHMPHTTTYSDKSTVKCDTDEKTQKNDFPTAVTEKSRETMQKAHMPLSTSQNTQANAQFAKDTVTKVKTSPLKNAGEKTNNKETCNNIFNIENIDNNLNAQTHMNQMNAIHFFPEKHKSLLPAENFNSHNSAVKNNMHSIFQDNVQNSPSFIKNFGASSVPPNEVTSFNIDNNASFSSNNLNTKDSNLNQSNQQGNPTQKSLIQPYFLQDNKNYQDISNQNNTKTLNMDNRNTDVYKYFNYNNFNSGNKKPLKNNEMNFNFNLENKTLPVPKITEPNQIAPNYNVTYANSIYDISKITKVCTYSSNKTISEPLYTNSNNNYNYYSNNESYIGDTCYKPPKNDKNQVLELETYGNYKRTDFNNSYFSDNLRKNNATSSKSENTQEKSTYNWMTTPTKSSSYNVISSFPKDDVIYSNANIISGSQSGYYNSTSMYPADFNTNLVQATKKPLDLPLVNINYQKSDVEEAQNQFTWSPTKMPQFLDPVPNFVSSTLPTLVGDLALGSSNFNDQKYEFTNKCVKDAKQKAPSKINFENQNNFLSVSQLVHQTEKTIQAKPVRRRNSGSISKNNQIKNKKVGKNGDEQKEGSQSFNKSPGNQSNVKIDNKNFNCRQTSHNSFCDKRSNLKVSSSNYSAEALIGHHGQSENNSKKDKIFSGNTIKNIAVPPYMPDNIMPYFPAVDLQQENIQQNQNYQNFPNFTTFPNNAYSTNTFIHSSTVTTPYISSSNFVSDIGVVNEFGSENMSLFPNNSIHKNKITNKNSAGLKEERNNVNNPCTNFAARKAKKKPNEINMTSNLVDFSFLSVPGSINSPLLPDDFHTHSTFLPPPTQPQLYPCKNSLYPPKQNTITSNAPLIPLCPLPPVAKSGIQHPEVSPSLNSVGTSSLTNFNLSTIFPEINKSSISDIYSENQSKDQVANRHYTNISVPFNSKSTFSYQNCPVTQPYGVDNR